MTGFPGFMSIPVLRALFSAIDDTIAQTDIVMLLTPRIIRTHEYTARDLSPIYVGTNQNFGLTGPPPLIAAPPVEPEAHARAWSRTAGARRCRRRGCRSRRRRSGGTPGQVTTPAAADAAAAAAARRSPTAGAARSRRRRRRPRWRRPRRSPSPRRPAKCASAAGPYMVPIYASNVSRASTVTLTVTYNPAVLRMRTVQEGSFLRQGGIERRVHAEYRRRHRPRRSRVRAHRRQRRRVRDRACWRRFNSTPWGRAPRSSPSAAS